MQKGEEFWQQCSGTAVSSWEVSGRAVLCSNHFEIGRKMKKESKRKFLFSPPLSKCAIDQSVMENREKRIKKESSSASSAVQYILYQLLSFPNPSKGLVLSYSPYPKQNNKAYGDQNYSTT